MEMLTLGAGLLLPWLLGVAALLAVRGTRRPLEAPGEIAWLAGAGYLVGAFLLTLWMRSLSIAGVRFGALSIAGPLALATAGLGFVAWRRFGALPSVAAASALRALFAPPTLSGVARTAWRVLLAWLALRFALLGLEVAWQPLYPWGAWIQWATKARVWYELGQIVPFVRGEAWLAGAGPAYFDASPEFPPTVPLLQVWSCVALGRWDDALMNWPWWQFAVALALAVYGALRSLDIPAVGAFAGAFAVATLPLANVHVALAGYADLPMAAYYTGAALAFLRWSAVRDAREAGLALLFAVVCTQTKNPGLGWALTLVPGVVAALLPRHAPRLAAIGFGVALFLLAVLAQTHPVIFKYPLHLDFDPAWQALGESYFLLANWNLLWYGAIVVALLAGRQLIAPALAPLTIIVASGALFLVVIFGFTNARGWVADQTTVNRATLHIAPLVIVFLVLAFRAFATRFAVTRAAASASGT